MSHAFSKPHYRDDLQILRAVAVIFVLLFHLKLDFLQGGYVGVDIFFVLSGFFIAQTLSEIHSWQDAKAFYNRRLRRILPLAWIVFLLLMIAGPFLFIPPELGTLSKDFLAAQFLAPNIGYWRDDSYFENSLFRPMLHYWSLGVEYHYYIIFPLALYIMQRWKWTAALFFAGSFALCVAVTALSAKTAFFWMPTRFWEFMLGYMAFRMQLRGVAFNPIARAVFLLSGIALLVASALFFTIKTPFPGYAAAVPAMGAFLFILGRMPHWPRFLRWIERILIGIGTISFSLYLWHYPVIFILTYVPFAYGASPDFVQGVIAVVVTFALSILSYFYIEEKFRNPKVMSNKTFYKWMAGLLAVSVLVAVFYPLSGYNKQAYTPKEQRIFFALKDQLPFRCGKLFRLLNPAEEFCPLASGSGKSVMLVGDSHMDALKPPFIELAPEHDVSLFFLVKNCKPGFGNCPVEMFMNEARKRKISDFVFNGITMGPEDLKVLDELIERLRAEKIEVHIIDPTPLFEKSIPLALFKGENIEVSVEQYRRENEEYFKWKRERKGVRFYETESILCPKNCPVENEDGVLYFDAHHLTVTGANLLKPIVGKIYD